MANHKFMMVLLSPGPNSTAGIEAKNRESKGVLSFLQTT